MRRDQLEHAIRTACQIIGRPEVIVVGSQSILGTFREDELPADATMSVEIDILPIADGTDEIKRLADLTRSERRSWGLHRRLSSHLTRSSLETWRATIEGNIERLRGSVKGQPHLRNLDRWQRMVQDEDLPSLRRVMTGLNTDSVKMSDVSTIGFLISKEERAEFLGLAIL